MPQSDSADSTSIAAKIAGWIFAALIIALLLRYVMDFWLDQFHRPLSWRWWHGALIGLMPGVWVGRCSVIAAVGTFLASFFV